MTASLYANLPAELRVLPNWIVWRLEYPNGLDKKPTKRPYQVNGQPASVTDPSHWVTFEVAFNQLNLSDKYTGLGFVFTNTDYSGIDLDDAKTFHTGEPNPNYQADLARQIKIAQEFDSYSEISPSGTGLHIIVKGKVPNGKRTNFIEVYPSGRFFTMTGQVHNNKPIGDYSDLLNQLWAQMGGVIENVAAPLADGSETITDEEILALARKHNAATFDDLANGIFTSYPSQSEADQAYCNIIAYYTNSKSQVERIFRKSKLMRSKVNVNKPYLPNTIRKAFDQKVAPLNFDKLKEQLNGSVAQLVEPTAHNSISAGSSPATSTIPMPNGLVGEIAQFIYSAAPRPVHEIALAGAIGLMAGICGKAYNISDTGLNQYILLIADSGKGKEAMASGISKIVNTARQQVPVANDFIGPSAIASSPGLHKFLSKNSQCFVSILGEFGIKLEAMSNLKANSVQLLLKDTILDLYHKSGYDDVYRGSAYSDQEKNSLDIRAPAFSILGESTPERFYSVLSEEMINEGLLPRFTIIEYTGIRVPFNENPAKVPPIPLMTKVCELMAHCKTIIGANKVINVQQSKEALELTKWIDDYSTKHINSANKELTRQLWNRAHLKTLKLAATLAIGYNPYNAIISLDDAQWAWNLVQSDIRALSHKFDEGLIGKSSSELKQSIEMTRIIREYVTKDFENAKKYGADERLHKDKIINNTYLNNRLGKLAIFQNDRIGGLAALKRCLQLFVDDGKLIALSGAVFTSKYETSQKAWAIHPSVLD